MLEKKGDIWKLHKEGGWIVVPTNGIVNKDGLAVMGRGLALDTKNKYPDFPKQLGIRLQKLGNRVFVFYDYEIITFPVKHHWKHPADYNLIHRSAYQLVEMVDLMGLTEVFLPHVGCGNGRLDWDQVKYRISHVLDNRFVALSY